MSFRQAASKCARQRIDAVGRLKGATRFSSSSPYRQSHRSAAWSLAAGVGAIVPIIWLLQPVHLDSDAVLAKTPPPKNSGRTVSVSEVLAHNKRDSLWVVINGEVYDMTEFFEDHPGGQDIIIKNAGKDVTSIFKPRHPSDQLEPDNLPETVTHIGQLEAGAADEQLNPIKAEGEEEEEARIAQRRKEIEEKGLGEIINLKDFERIAEELLSKIAWAYYASAGDDEITKVSNATAYQHVQFRPRVLRKVGHADASTTILGQPSSIPVFVSPAAMAKLGHPDGEVNLTKGAGETGIIQCISSNASCSLEEMTAARIPNQPLFFQLYVNRDRKLANALVAKVNRLNMDAIFLTTDAPVGGKRERDLRVKGEFEMPDDGVGVKDGGAGVSGAMFAGVDPDLNWEDIAWLRSQTKLPIVIKGIQTVEDALLAHAHGCDGILISNHGGRQLDTTRPSLDVLLEIRKHAPHLLPQGWRGPTGFNKERLGSLGHDSKPDTTSADERKFEIFIDGGISRGTDVCKALCLGAKAVGLGRPFLFAQSVAGDEGVIKAVNIMEQEILLAMRLLGANKVEDLKPEMVEVKE